MLCRTTFSAWLDFLFCQNCQPAHPASPAPKAVSSPLHFSSPAENADKPAAPPSATATSGSQQQLVAKRKAKAEPSKVCRIFMLKYCKTVGSLHHQFTRKHTSLHFKSQQIPASSQPWEVCRDFLNARRQAFQYPRFQQPAISAM